MPKVTFREDECKGCGLCVHVCPKKILEMAQDRINKKGFNPAQMAEPEKCIGCAICATMCPDVVIRVEK